MKSALDDEVPIVRLAIRIIREQVSHKALGTMVGRYVAGRLGATMAMDCVLHYDEIPHIAADVRAIVQWCEENSEAASALILFVENAERRHPESLALRAREVFRATRYRPVEVIKAAAELERHLHPDRLYPTFSKSEIS